MGAVNSGNANSFSSALSAAGFGMSGSDITFNGQSLGTQQQLSSEVSNASSSTSLQDATENYASWATTHPILSTIVSTVVGNIIPGAGLLASIIKMIGNHYINKNIKRAQSNTAEQGNYFINQSTGNQSQDFIGNSDFNGAYSRKNHDGQGPTATVGPLQDVTNQYTNSGNIDYGSTQNLIGQESWNGDMGSSGSDIFNGNGYAGGAGGGGLHSLFGGTAETE